MAGPWPASGAGRSAALGPPLLKAADPPLPEDPLPEPPLGEAPLADPRGSQESWSADPAETDADELLWAASDFSPAAEDPAPGSGGTVVTPAAGLTSGPEPAASGLPSVSQSSGSERFSTPSSSEPSPELRLSPGCGLCLPDVFPPSAITLVRRPNVPVRCNFRLTAIFLSPRSSLSPEVSPSWGHSRHDTVSRPDRGRQLSVRIFGWAALSWGLIVITSFLIRSDARRP